MNDRNTMSTGVAEEDKELFHRAMELEEMIRGENENAALKRKQGRVKASCRSAVRQLLNGEPLPSREVLQAVVACARRVGLEDDRWVQIIVVDILTVLQ